MQFAPAYVDRQPLTAEEEAYNFLLDAICGGRYRKGDRLIAEDIASEIGMSRMPVREAFRRLDAQGLVTLRPNRGAIVSGLDIDELHEVFAVAYLNRANKINHLEVIKQNELSVLRLDFVNKKVSNKRNV